MITEEEEGGTKSRATPVAVLGHSLGEYAGAVTAGALSLETASRMVYVRALILEKKAKAGECMGLMLAVRAPFEVLEAKISSLNLQQNVAVAANNGDNNCVLSGPVTDVRAVAAALGGVYRELSTGMCVACL